MKMIKALFNIIVISTFVGLLYSCSTNADLVIPSSTPVQGSSLTASPFVYAKFQGAVWKVSNPTYYYDSNDTTITVSASSTNASLTFVVYNSDVNKSIKSAVATYNSNVYYLSSGSVSLSSSSSSNSIGASGNFNLLFKDSLSIPSVIEFKDGSFFAKP